MLCQKLTFHAAVMASTQQVSYNHTLCYTPAPLDSLFDVKPGCNLQAPVMGGISGPDSPTLGAGDLHAAKCRLGLAYEKLPVKLKQASLFGDSNKADLAEVEVYFCPEIAALY